MNWETPGWMVPFGAICAGTGLCMAVFHNDALVWPGLWIFIATLVAANIERFERFKAGSGGVEFEARKVVAEARGTISEMQYLARQVAQMSLSLVKRSARIGGFPPAEEEKIRFDMESLLRKTGVPDVELPGILDEWHRWVLLDYVFGILGNGMTPQGIEADAVEEWREMRRLAFRDERPPPEQLSAWLDRHTFLDEERRELIKDYAFYAEHKSHRRFDIWEKHAEWPALRANV